MSRFALFRIKNSFRLPSLRKSTAHAWTAKLCVQILTHVDNPASLRSDFEGFNRLHRELPWRQAASRGFKHFNTFETQRALSERSIETTNATNIFVDYIKVQIYVGRPKIDTNFHVFICFVLFFRTRTSNDVWRNGFRFFPVWTYERRKLWFPRVTLKARKQWLGSLRFDGTYVRCDCDLSPEAFGSGKREINRKVAQTCDNKNLLPATAFVRIKHKKVSVFKSTPAYLGRSTVCTQNLHKINTSEMDREHEWRLHCVHAISPVSCSSWHNISRDGAERRVSETQWTQFSAAVDSRATTINYSSVLRLQLCRVWTWFMDLLNDLNMQSRHMCG